MDDAGSGGTAIYDPRGEVAAKVESKFEQQATSRIPMAAFRERHKIPDVHMALYQPIFEKYRPRYEPGLFSDYQPTSLQDAKRFLETVDKWQ